MNRYQLLALSLYCMAQPALSGTEFRMEIPENIFDHEAVGSCQDILLKNPNAKSGYDVIFPSGFFGPSRKVFCDQETDGGGWTRIKVYDKYSEGCLVGFSDQGSSCLKNDRLKPIQVNSLGIRYQEIRGRVVAQQFGSTNAFRRYNASSDINDIYVDGISITIERENDTKEHVFTYAIAISNSVSGDSRACPRFGGTAPPSFVGDNYACASGNPSGSWSLRMYDVNLFTGDEFHTTLSQPTSAPIDMRIMNDEYINNEGIGLVGYYIYLR